MIGRLSKANTHIRWQVLVIAWGKNRHETQTYIRQALDCQKWVWQFWNKTVKKVKWRIKKSSITRQQCGWTAHISHKRLSILIKGARQPSDC